MLAPGGSKFLPRLAGACALSARSGCVAQPALCLAAICYRLLAIVLKVLLRLAPRTPRAEIAATAIRAAIRLYSIAATPLSFLNRSETSLDIWESPCKAV